MKSARALVLLAVAALAAACATPRPLVDPPAMAAAPTPGLTRAAILRALIESHYSIESEKPGEIVARYSRSGWTMVVSIAYSDQVAVRYLSSENLGYRVENGTPLIHRGYNSRVQRLAREIGTQVALASIGSDTPAVSAPPARNPQPQ